MNIKNTFKALLSMVFVAVTLLSCVHNDDYDTPPVNCNNKFPTTNISMADFMALAPATGSVKITDDYFFDGYVISSDENGNFFKTISFQDSPTNPTKGLQIEVDKTGNYADFPIGSHIRISAKGLKIGLDKGIIKIGSDDPDFPIGRIPSSLISKYVAGVCNGNGLDIQKITPLPLSSLGEAKQQQYVNILVTVPFVQFSTEELGKTYLEYSGGAGVDTDRNLEDNTGGSGVLRNSGFASFGSTLLPKGNGALTFVVSKYINSYQMLIRSLNDVKIPNAGLRFDPAPPKGGSSIIYSGSFTENFESYATNPANLEAFPKYINDPFTGNRYWQLNSFSNNKYIQLSAFNAGGPIKTYFAIPVNFTAANSLSFKVNIGSYNGQPLKIYTTTDYTPLGDFGAATLNDITSSFTLPTTPTSGFGTFTNAGTYNFPVSLTGNGFIVFEYKGIPVTTTIQLDDIVVN